MIDLNNIIKNGGATLTTDLQEVNFNDGFYVSLYGYEKTIDLNNIVEIWETLKEYQKIVKTFKKAFIGLWCYKNNLYIDITKHYTDKTKAKKEGLKNKQLSIYDVKNKKDVFLTNYYILYKVDKIKNDFIYVKEFTSLKDIKKALKLKNDVSIYHYIINSIDEQIDQLYKDNYIIVLDHDRPEND